MARTPLAAFFNIPTKNNPLSPSMVKPLTILRHRPSFSWSLRHQSYLTHLNFNSPPHDSEKSDVCQLPFGKAG